MKVCVGIVSRRNMKYDRECLACFQLVHHERYDVYFRYHKRKRHMPFVGVRQLKLF